LLSNLRAILIARVVFQSSRFSDAARHSCMKIFIGAAAFVAFGPVASTNVALADDVAAKPDVMSADHMSSDHMGTTKKPTTTKHAMEEHMVKPDTVSSDHMAPKAPKQQRRSANARPSSPIRRRRPRGFESLARRRRGRDHRGGVFNLTRCSAVVSTTANEIAMRFKEDKSSKSQLTTSTLATCLVFCLATSAASAAERRTFDAKTFASAQTSGTPVLVEISATWCPTCKAQKLIIDSLAEQPENRDLIISGKD
jgi:thiol-disulfide isomerase/thioredoxin